MLKIATKVVHSARYIEFKLCSNYPYKDEFYETLENIRRLQPKLEWQDLRNLDSKKRTFYIYKDTMSIYRKISWSLTLLAGSKTG